MTLKQLFFIAGLVSVSNHSFSQNSLNQRFFYSKPALYNSKSKVKHVNFSCYDIMVALPTDDRSKFNHEEVYKHTTTHPLVEFFKSPTVEEIQDKIISDLKLFSRGRCKKTNKLLINPTVEVFYPMVHGLLKAKSFAKVRLNISTELNGAEIFQQKYESLYVTNGMDNDFEGDITMTMEQGENVTVGMALRQALDQYYYDLNRILKLGNNQIILSGSTVNAKTKIGVSTPISFQSDSLFSATSSSNGKFQIILPKKNCHVQIIAPNFINYTEAIHFDSSDARMISKVFQLQPIEKGLVVKLKNVLFYMGTANLLESSYDELNAVVSFLNVNPKVKIALSGHTDNQGDALKDLKLSQDRVEKIKDYLVSKKIRARRISGKGFGASKPISSNDTEEGRKLNRRVEFVILTH